MVMETLFIPQWLVQTSLLGLTIQPLTQILSLKFDFLMD